jgi:hypothetical protein
LCIFAGVSLLALCCTSALAQQVTGIPGSPGAATTIDGKHLPPPDPAFGGVIKEKASESTAWWAPRVVPPKGAPNVLLIMTDDQGFGAPSTFGGVIPTPPGLPPNGHRRQGLLPSLCGTAVRDFSSRSPPTIPTKPLKVLPLSKPRV